MIILRLLRQFPLQPRIIGGFLVSAVLISLFLPFFMGNLQNMEDRLTTITDVESRADRQMLTASLRVATAQQKLTQYTLGELDSVEEALKDVDEALSLLRSTQGLIQEKEQRDAVGQVLSSLLNYRIQIGEIEQARTQNNQGEITRLEQASREASNEMGQRLEEIVSLNDAQIAEANDRVINDARQRNNTSLVIAVIGLVLSAVIMAGVAWSITNPVTELRVKAEIFQRGRMDNLIEEIGSDELTLLARTFNKMASQIGGLIGNLERRVEDRTSELQKRASELEAISKYSEARANQLQAVAHVSRVTSQIQNIEELLPRVSEVISKEFGFYHVGVFLVDTRREFAVLTASNSEGGKRMLGKNHKLRIGQTGIVGYVANTGRARIALDTGSDSVYFNNPDLPDTHSEMALPIKLGNETVGVLDIQSSKSNAFKGEDVEVLTIVAEQVSIAIYNARQFEEAQKAVAQAEEIYRQYLRREWKSSEQSDVPIGYRYQVTGVEALREIPEEMIQTLPSQIAVPIKLRGEIIGLLKATGNEAYEWDQDELDIAEAVAERVALAIENARLLNDSQTQAAKEHTIGAIASKISSSTDRESILRVTVEELGKIMGAKEVFFELETEEDA